MRSSASTRQEMEQSEPSRHDGIGNRAIKKDGGRKTTTRARDNKHSDGRGVEREHRYGKEGWRAQNRNGNGDERSVRGTMTQKSRFGA